MDLKRPNKLRLSGKSGANDAPVSEGKPACPQASRSTRSRSSSPT